MRFYSASVLLCLSLAPFGAFAQSEFDPGDSNVMRIENEDKLTVPLEKTEEVWEYILDRFATNSGFLVSIDPLLTGTSSDEFFEDTYYDTPAFVNLEKQNGLRHRKRVNLKNTDDKKSGRELMQIKVNGIADDPLSRAEYKFDIEYPTSFETSDDRHPLIGLVTPSQREDFKARVQETLGINPYDAKEILTIKQHRRRVYIKRDGVSAFTISYDVVTSTMGDVEIKLTEIEPEINEIMFTEGDEDERSYLKNLQSKLIEDIQQKFPFIKRDLTPKYNKAFERFEEQIPLLKLRIAYGTENMIAIAGLVILAPIFLLGAWLFSRRRPSIA